MPNNSNPNPTSAPTKPACITAPSPKVSQTPADYPAEEHVGTFAEGESNPTDHPEEEHVGTFAEGESDPEAHPEEEHVGTFRRGRGPSLTRDARLSQAPRRAPVTSTTPGAGCQSRSSSIAIPWPPPMQRVTSPSLWFSRSISPKILVVRIAPVAAIG